MISKRLVYARPDGGISIVVPIPRPGETEEQTLARCSVRAVPEGVPFEVIDASALPASRRWRNAWRLSGAAIAHHLPTARQIRRAELLGDRDARLVRVRRREQEAREDGQAAAATALRARAVTLRGLEAQLDADLAVVADLAALEAYQPAAFGAPD